MLDKLKKYSKRKKNNKEEDKDIFSFDLNVLTLFCSFVISDNKNIKKNNYLNMKTLFDRIDDQAFADSPEKMERVYFIRKGLEARVDKNLRNSVLILKHINGGLIEPDRLDIQEFGLLSNDELMYINETVSACLKYSDMNNMIDQWENAIEEYKNTDYRDRGKLIPNIEELTNTLQNHFRQHRNFNMEDEYFSLSNGIFEDKIYETYDALVDVSNKLRTGMVGLDNLLAGGLEKGRCYVLYGLPGEGKSMTLLDIAHKVKKYNTKYQVKDPTKKPCILFLTMENSMKETIERLYNISTTISRMSNSTPDKIIHDMRNAGMVLNDESPIDIIVKWVAGMSVDTSYLYKIANDLEDQGYELVLIVQDYIKRIRSIYREYWDNPRYEYGSIVNEFKTFATLKDIPILTASQLNRDATKNIDEGRKTNKVDLLKLIGRSNIGESMLMLENADGSYLIAPEVGYDGLKYMGIQCIKKRYYLTGNLHMYQPFDSENPARLVEDYGWCEPSFKLTLRPEQEQVMESMKKGRNPYMRNEIAIVDDEENISLLKNPNCINLQPQYTNVDPPAFLNADYNSNQPMTDGAKYIISYKEEKIS